MKPFIDPGEDTERARKQRSSSVPPPPSLFDTSEQPPDTPFQVRSSSSIDAAGEMSDEQRSQRREAVFRAIADAGDTGIPRFRIAARLDVPDHWITSSVDALIKTRRVEELPNRWEINPRSGKRVGVLIAIQEDVAA